MKLTTFTMRTDSATLAIYIMAVALSLSAIVIIDAYNDAGNGFHKAIAFLPFVILSILMALNNSRQMSVRWNSFLVSSVVSRKETIDSLFAPNILIYVMTAMVTALMSTILFPEEDMTGCVCLSFLISSLSLTISQIYFSDSVSSLASDILGVVTPIALLIALYMMSEEALSIDLLGSILCIIATVILFLSGWMVSNRMFRSKDI